MSGRSPAGGMGWVRRLAAALLAFAVLGTALPAAAQTDVWTATFTPGNLGSGFFGCSIDIGGNQCSMSVVRLNGPIGLVS